jgi:hypothetical protein
VFVAASSWNARIKEIRSCTMGPGAKPLSCALNLGARQIVLFVVRFSKGARQTTIHLLLFIFL